MSETRIGRIYKIVCSKSNEVYVGSTFNALRTRMSQHKRAYNQKKMLYAYNTFRRYGWDSLSMILIEEYQVVDRKHLQMYEQLYINKLQAVNKVQAFSVLRRPVAYEDTPKRKAHLLKRKYWNKVKELYNCHQLKIPYSTHEIEKLESNPIISIMLKSTNRKPFVESLKPTNNFNAMGFFERLSS